MSTHLMRRRSQTSGMSERRGSVKKRDISSPTPLPPTPTFSEYSLRVNDGATTPQNGALLPSHYPVAPDFPSSPIPSQAKDEGFSYGTPRRPPIPPVTFVRALPQPPTVSRRPSVVKRKPVPAYCEEDFLPYCGSTIGSVVEEPKDLREQYKTPNKFPVDDAYRPCDATKLGSGNGDKARGFYQLGEQGSSISGESRFTERFSIAADELGTVVLPKLATNSFSTCDAHVTYPTYSSVSSKTSKPKSITSSRPKTGILSRLSRSFSVSNVSRPREETPPLPIPASFVTTSSLPVDGAEKQAKKMKRQSLFAVGLRV